MKSSEAMSREAESMRVPRGGSAVLGSKVSVSLGHGRASADAGGARHGLLIVNADDWGQDRETTDRTFDCIVRGSVSSVSAMVFMEDSERAAVIARGRGIDAGLHLNLTTRFSAPYCPSLLNERQSVLASYLLRYHPLGRVVFHPGLFRCFEYVVAAQREEFFRLYGAEPKRLDGHHHVHLCSNVLFGGLLPPGTIVRRNFSFQAGEKSWYNRLYRRIVDQMLARRHRLTDFFFSLDPVDQPGRLQRIFSLARQCIVEVATHPLNPVDYQFLLGGEIFRLDGDVQISRCFPVSESWSPSDHEADLLTLRR